MVIGRFAGKVYYRHMKKYIFAVVFSVVLSAIMVTGVHVASAQVTTHSIHHLIEQLQLLQQRLYDATNGTAGTNYQQVPTNAVGTQAGTNGRGVFGGGYFVDEHLDVGSRGELVRQLQQFLAQDPSVYPEQEVTGYFGYATERAVTRFQSRCGIFPPAGWNGDWFGCTGPLTRNALRYGCNVQPEPVVVPPPAPLTPLPGHACSLNVSPATGQAPLTVTINALVNANRACSAATYTITTTDGMRSVRSVHAGQCATTQEVLTHTFTNPGQYTVRCDVPNGSSREARVYVTQPPVPACSVSVTAQSNGVTTLTWQTYNALSARFDQNIGEVGLSGSRTTTVTQPTRYTMTVTGTGGVTQTCFAEVQVTPAPVHAPWCSLYSTYATIRAGDSATLHWSSEHGSEVTLNDGAHTESVATSGSKAISPSSSTTYTLQVTNGSGTTQCTAPVTVQAYSQGGYYGQGSYGGDSGGGDSGGGDSGGGDGDGCP